MSDEDIPGPTRQFIIDHIGSVAELELLLLLRQHAQRDWSAREVARELRVEMRWTARTLDELRAEGLLARPEGPAVRYRYCPSSLKQGRTIDEMARCYEERRVSLVTLIYSKPRDHIRSFANAFRLWEDK